MDLEFDEYGRMITPLSNEDKRLRDEYSDTFNKWDDKIKEIVTSMLDESFPDEKDKSESRYVSNYLPFEDYQNGNLDEAMARADIGKKSVIVNVSNFVHKFENHKQLQSQDMQELYVRCVMAHEVGHLNQENGFEKLKKRGAMKKDFEKENMGSIDYLIKRHNHFMDGLKCEMDAYHDGERFISKEDHRMFYSFNLQNIKTWKKMYNKEMTNVINHFHGGVVPDEVKPLMDEFNDMELSYDRNQPDVKPFYFLPDEFETLHFTKINWVNDEVIEYKGEKFSFKDESFLNKKSPEFQKKVKKSKELKLFKEQQIANKKDLSNSHSL